MPNKPKSLPLEKREANQNKRECSAVIVTQSKPEQRSALPSLDASEQAFFYSQKLADAEMARIETARINRMIADATSHFNAGTLSRLRSAIAETLRFLGWEGGEQ